MKFGSHNAPIQSRIIAAVNPRPFDKTAQNAVHRPRVVPYVREKNVTYTILYGNDRVAAAYDGVPLLPTSFFIGTDGKIAGEFEGIKTKNDLELAILRALAPPELRGGTTRN